MNTKSKAAIVDVCLVAGSAVYASPYFAVRGMRATAQEKDAARLSSYVNFPAVKESLKGAFNAKLAAEAAKNGEKSPFGVLGAAMAAALINPMIDALVTPEGLAMMLKGDKPTPAAKQAQAQPEPSPADAETTMGYEGFDRFVVTAKKKGSSEEPVGFVFNREGLFSWKLSAVRFPL